MIKVMIVDDQAIFKEGLRMILNQDPDIEVISLCENGKEAVELSKIYKPDVILMDIKMPVLNGVEAVKLISKEINIIMLTTFHDEEYIYDAVRYGASGYLLKDTSIDVIIDAVKTVHSGGALINPEVAKIILNQFTHLASATADVALENDLTDREVEISKLVAAGLNNKEISDKLYIGIGTVKNHITKILQKLELRDRTQLAIYALKNKF